MIMKRTIILLAASFMLALRSSSADDTKAVSAVIELNGMSAPQVLSLYQKFCGHELIVDSRAKAVRSPITIHASSAPPLPKEEVIKRFREAFLLAGIVITPLDDKRESVTYNDALPVMIDFDRVPVTDLIDKYQQLTGLELVCDSRARVTSSAITLHTATPLTKDEATKLLENTLLTQASVVIARLDDKRASVTRKDALQTTH